MEVACSGMPQCERVEEGWRLCLHQYRHASDSHLNSSLLLIVLMAVFEYRQSSWTG